MIKKPQPVQLAPSGFSSAAATARRRIPFGQ
jgi:hypothetical protein